MIAAAPTLAEFAASLAREAMPAEVTDRAKSCVIGTVGAVTFGAAQPWCRIIIEHVMRASAAGICGAPAPGRSRQALLD